MTKVLEKPVVILGGGACVQTFAADFTLDYWQHERFGVHY